MVRWPSWLWRQVKVHLNTDFLVTKVAWVQVPLSSAFVSVHVDWVYGNLLFCGRIVCGDRTRKDGMVRIGAAGPDVLNGIPEP